MKIFILATMLFASTAFADQYVKLGDIKGEVEDAAAPVIDNEENAANDVRTSGEGSTGQARRRADVTMKDVSTDRRITNTGDETADEINGQIEMLSPNLEETENGFGNDLDNGSTKAQDYNSSRCNRRGARAANHNSTRSNRGRRLDTDDDDDSVDTRVNNAVDNDCDDDRADETK